MTGDQAGYSLYLILFLLLVVSSLVARRLPIKQTLKMAAAWIAIFAVGFAIFAFRSEFSALGSRLKAEATGSPIQQGEELRIPIANDGHFWVDAAINGENVRFLVDSGASVTTISSDLAARLGIETGSRVAKVETANGTVIMQRASADQFSVGQISRSDFPLFVNPRGGSNVLGMNFLSSLRSWRVEGTYLVMTP